MMTMQTLFNKYKLLLVLCFILMVTGCAFFYHSTQDRQADSQQESEPFPDVVPEASQMNDDILQEGPAQDIFVDVKGAVKKPGIYKAIQSERVNDLIIRAGGFTDEASEVSVNLAQKVTDEMVIYVPKAGEEGEENQEASMYAQSEKNLLDINKATEQDFDALPGIGPAKAKAIVDYRTEKGPFKAVDDLKGVSGIGEATFERLKESISVN
jgi:competence protein ComEA